MSSRSRRPKQGTPFDRLLKQQCQKVVIGASSKSSTEIGKWGTAQFTSMRTSNGSSSSSTSSGGVGLPPPPVVVVRNPKRKFFKSRREPDVVKAEDEEEVAAAAILPVVVLPSTAASPMIANKTNKLFTTSAKKRKGCGGDDDVENRPQGPKVPPLKLRLKVNLPPPSPPPAPEPPAIIADSPEGSDVDNAKSEEEEDDDLSTPFEQSWLSEEIGRHRDQLERDQQLLMLPAVVPLPSPPKKEKVEESDTSKSHSKEATESESSVNVLRTRSRAVKAVAKTKCDDRVPEASLRREQTLSAKLEEMETNLEPKKEEVEEPEASKIHFKESESSVSVLRTYSRAVKTFAKTKCDEQVPEASLQRAQTLPAKLEEEVATNSEPKSTQSRPVEVTKPSSKFFSSGKTTTRSIFKSKSAEGKKGRLLYKHNWNAATSATAVVAATANEDGDEVVKSKTSTSSIAGQQQGFEFDEDDDSNRLIRVTSLAASGCLNRFDETAAAKEVVSVKCPKSQKGYFTVIKNVKKAHQIQDSGEFQEFNDDVEYILEGLGSHNNLSTRCLSTVTLASKCTEPAFRMHLRAHGTVTRFFNELRDAPQNPSLALCASAVLFVLSQDRLNMDLDRESLELMLNLLDADSRIKDDALEDSGGMNRKELVKNKQKVQELCSVMKDKGRAAGLSLQHVSADHLAMETLLSLTSKRAGEWFKEELRELGGLDHLVRTMSDCVGYLSADEITIWTEPLHDKLNKADRVLKVLESVTYESEENCRYLLGHDGGEFLHLVHSLFRLLDEELPLHPCLHLTEDKESVGHTIRESLLDVIRVYVNLVHDYKKDTYGSRLSGEQEGTFDLILHCMFILPDYMPAPKRFDVLVLSLTFVINLIEHCRPNRSLLANAIMPPNPNDLFVSSCRPTAPEGFVKLFLEKEENARRLETKTDKILDGEKDEDDEEEKKSLDEEKAKSHEEFIDETVKKVLNKAGKHMEDTLIASYLTLILGYLILEDKECEAKVRSMLPQQNFVVMVAVLKKFFDFMNLTASSTVMSNRGLKATEMILKHLESLDKPSEVEDSGVRTNAKDEENFDDLTIFEVSKDDGDDNEGNSSNVLDNTVSSPFLGADDDFGKL